MSCWNRRAKVLLVVSSTQQPQRCNVRDGASATDDTGHCGHCINYKFTTVYRRVSLRKTQAFLHKQAKKEKLVARRTTAHSNLDDSRHNHHHNHNHNHCIHNHNRLTSIIIANSVVRENVPFVLHSVTAQEEVNLRNKEFLPMNAARASGCALARAWQA
jgi:hypothetical protein